MQRPYTFWSFLGLLLFLAGAINIASGGEWGLIPLLIGLGLFFGGLIASGLKRDG